jgi:hypothetical protein
VPAPPIAAEAVAQHARMIMIVIPTIAIPIFPAIAGRTNPVLLNR